MTDLGKFHLLYLHLSLVRRCFLILRNNQLGEQTDRDREGKTLTFVMMLGTWPFRRCMISNKSVLKEESSRDPKDAMELEKEGS